MTGEIDRLVNALEAVLKHRDSILIRVYIDDMDDEGFRLVKQLGGKRIDGPVPRRLPQTVLQAPTRAGWYLVRVCPLDPVDATTWDWHDWRECP